MGKFSIPVFDPLGILERATTDAPITLYDPLRSRQQSSTDTEKVTVQCPICRKVIEIPAYDRVSRSEALKKHLEEEHIRGGHSSLGDSRFIGGCKVSNGLCLTHGYSVSQTVKCPKSELTDEEWSTVWELAEEAFPDGQGNPWVDKWWPATVAEVEETVSRYATSLREAARKYALRAREAAAKYSESAEKAIYHYRQYALREYYRGKA